ncbi:IclR family transcriptional regulator [Arthrobacter sp. I2-34]|uniref:IclR family transcriptional regulator n=1 Tax=Arthrobacter hankyongi TaxID=2904801 RepID=A0ABS9L3D1_9MICC|nr:IclR family transcriptional regulator [Arthrobacter hankyongi]MCG2621195.1 IclR family transcriptional regulator [Arthrobacter hankyongi]
MQKQRTPRRKPTYAIEAVDNALQLLQLLRDFGSLRLKDAAAELGVAPSTAHRLLAMLVYRGFAAQDESKRYLPGPSLGVGPAGVSWTTQLRAIAQPHLEVLALRLNETVNLMIRVGTQVRFLSTVEGTGILRVGDRQGTVLPARRASGGKAILAELPPEMLEQLYRSPAAEAAGDALTDDEFPGFTEELRAIRNTGFAANFEGTEEGVSALGLALHNGAGRVLGAISVATPATRFRKVFDAGLVPEVLRAKAELEVDLADFLPETEGMPG